MHLAEVQVGDRLRVRPGEKAPVDGVVRRAAARSTIDGHRRADPGGRRPRATRHRRHHEPAGSLIVRAEKVGSDTMLARIVQMVAEAQR